MSDSRKRITLYAIDLEPELSQVKAKHPRLSHAQIATLLVQRAREIAGTIDPFKPTQPTNPGPAAAPQRMPRRRRPTEEGKHESRGYAGTVPFQVDRNDGGLSIIGSCDGYTFETDVSEETACDFPQAA